MNSGANERVAGRSVGSWVARAISPSFAARRARGVAGAGGPGTSVDPLTWDHPLLADLERAGAAAGVPFHSIIAALREPPAEGATDGVVPVASARLGTARSEVVVRANHICYPHAEVIQEVRRVLIEHAASLSRPPRSEPWRSPSVGRGRPDPPRVEQFGIVVGHGSWVDQAIAHVLVAMESSERPTRRVSARGLGPPRLYRFSWAQQVNPRRG
jgi:hypothetical protein